VGAVHATHPAFADHALDAVSLLKDAPHHEHPPSIRNLSLLRERPHDVVVRVPSAAGRRIQAGKIRRSLSDVGIHELEELASLRVDLSPRDRAVAAREEASPQILPENVEPGAAELLPPRILSRRIRSGLTRLRR